MDAAKPAPFSDGEFSFAKNASNVGRGIEFLDNAFSHQHLENALDSVKSLL